MVATLKSTTVTAAETATGVSARRVGPRARRTRLTSSTASVTNIPIQTKNTTVFNASATAGLSATRRRLPGPSGGM